MKLSSVVLLLGFCSFPGSTQAHIREKRSSAEPADMITVTLKMEWKIRVIDKPLPASYVTKVKNGTVLIDILNKAAGDNKQGPFNKYDSTYFSDSGYYITAMNGTENKSPYNWFVFDEQTGQYLSCGESFYVPVNQSTTIFRYTTYTRPWPKDKVSGYCPLEAPIPSYGQVPPPAITVTLEQDWDVASVGKPIPAPYTTQVTNGTVLLDIVNKAAYVEPDGPYNGYKSTYYGGLGHLITSMDKVNQDPSTSTYWMIYDKASGKPTPLGVDSYKPQNGSTTIFRLVPGASHETSTATAKTESLTETESPSSSGKFFGMGLVILCILAGLEGLLFL